ncbi:MAG: hypothetical protein RIQ47_1816 [Bacteroidota bacterium]|jgi:hypothetical protein
MEHRDNQALQHSSIFGIENEVEFARVALDVFHYQSESCSVYKRYLQLLDVHAQSVVSVAEIPFLPIEIFREAPVIAEGTVAQMVFRSSGTTGTITSSHHVADLSMYRESLLKGFRRCYGSPADYTFLALLPTYIERPDASLIYMVKALMEDSGQPFSGFYIDDLDALYHRIIELQKAGKKIFLLGVTFALLDFADRYSLQLDNAIVVETGGMKGRRKEIIRDDLHERLCERLGVNTIHSEYGMTELLSQAWSKGSGRYTTPPWMHIDIGDMNDPFQRLGEGTTGVIRVIDLANLYSCSFIATQDIGKKYADGTFEVLGRIDNSDLRGCNLMVQ